VADLPPGWVETVADLPRFGGWTVGDLLASHGEMELICLVGPPIVVDLGVVRCRRR
jgi:hypothetical protein